MISLLLEWLVANQMVFWFLLALFCLLFEMGSPGLFFFLSFFFGALVAGGFSFVTTMWLWQALSFLISSFVAFLILHRWVKKKVDALDPRVQTNVYAMRSKRGRVIQHIFPDKMGIVKVDGERWSARSLHGTAIKEDTEVIVVRIKGAHLVVEEVKEKNK